MQDTIRCPKCGETIKLSQVISGDIETEVRKKYEDRILKEKAAIEDKLRKEIKLQERQEADNLRMQLEEKEKRLDEARKHELQLRRERQGLEEEKRSLAIELERRIDGERKRIAEKVARDAEEAHRLKDAEKDKRLSDMMKQIEDLKRKAEQGSQKTQGEVLELELEQLLKDEFPFDGVEPVEAGKKGGDVVHTVITQSGRPCGKILWETKRTKDWNNAWIQKLKDDQREAKADLAVIVSEALPKGFHHFREIEGVWVTDIPSALPLALALRLALVKEERARQAQTGKEGKMELVYGYLTGVEFRNRVQAIMEAFVGLRQDLDAEKRATEKIWSRREKNIEKVVRNIAGMHGELEGMAGALPAVKLLELPTDTVSIDAEKEVV